MQTKYIGTILEGRWKVIGKSGYRNFELQNIYNETIITIVESVFYRILKNETTISKVISSRISPDKYNKQKRFAICKRKFEQKNKR